MSNFTYDDLIEVANRFATVTIRESSVMIEQFRFPKSRKRRIRNKWTKREENWRPMRHGVFDKARKTLYVHPEIAALCEAML